MSVLVIGSVAFDSVETPFGKVVNALGGSAVYFATAASLYTKVNLVAVVGTDFPEQHIRFLTNRGVDCRGLQVVDGETFCWAGRYNYKLNTTETLDTRLNVFADFHPILPDGYEKSDFVFLANIDPDLQYEVLQQVRGAKLVAADTMDFWIREKKKSLIKALSAVDVVIMNEAEARMFAETTNTIIAAKQILQLGPKAVIIKKGEYGSIMLTDTTYFVAPAYPLEEVKDPTGAGDTFAGGFMGYLAKVGEVTPETMKKAIINGNLIASFAVQEFSIDRLRSLSLDKITKRYQEFRQFIYFGTL